MLLELFIAISEVCVLFITMLRLSPFVFCFTSFMAPPASDRWELILASRQSWSMFSFFHLCRCDAGSVLCGWLACDLWPRPPDP